MVYTIMPYTMVYNNTLCNLQTQYCSIFNLLYFATPGIPATPSSYHTPTTPAPSKYNLLHPLHYCLLTG